MCGTSTGGCCTAGCRQRCWPRRREAGAFSEWIDGFYARDILELFNVRNRVGFLSLFRPLLRWSGGQLDYSRLARLSELSFPTVKAHLESLATAHAVHLLRPFHGGGRRGRPRSSSRIVSHPFSKVTKPVSKAFECRIDPDELDPAGVETFRAAYPQGENYLVAPLVKEPYRLRCGTRVFTVCATEALP